MAPQKYIPPQRRSPSFSSNSSSPTSSRSRGSSISSFASSRTPSPKAAPIRAWRVNAMPLANGLPSFPELKEGYVCFLPSVPPPMVSRIHQGLASRPISSPWNHAAVVTRKFTGNGEECIKFRLCTTFGNKTLQEHKNKWHWQYFLAAEGTECPQFSRNTYVNMSPNSEYTIEYKHIQLWCGNNAQTYFKGEKLRDIVGGRLQYWP